MNNKDLAELREYTVAINNMLKLNDFGAVLWLVDNMPRSLAHHVKPILEHNKQAFVRYILEKINRYGLDDNLVTGAINALDTARINWPELTAIKKSMAAEGYKRLGIDW